ncbi:MAG: type II toxin-antitoxin system HicA family toxin [Rhodospirillales bacterium]|nr:type II toxin-antitoxin system HicA family toxin [Alphaproteobacteria bacterium]MCB9987641.1 type II toxin-antitoxin system HicA family toxin [Rhodospirillales bacterium]USO08060.1 MAG: type II toxin-antitoxin system HicA family toxin [Rhodospirillales bacterium]
MTSPWYLNATGAGKSGQVIPSEQLVRELKRLECRFRQRGSHITFTHDETGIRGTIVYGTRKLWSQKTVADAILKICAAQTPAENDTPPTPETGLAGTFRSIVAAPALPIPNHIATENPEGDAAQIILRHRQYPQIGALISAYDCQDVVRDTLRRIDREARDFGETLECLETEGDFTAGRQPDGTLIVTHPIHEIQAVLEPFDPQETQGPTELLSLCFDCLADYADNQHILKTVVESRKLELDREKPMSDGTIEKIYVARKFGREFGIRVNAKVSKHGHISDADLLGLIDDADQNFFSEIEHFIKNSYGFTVKKDRDGDRINATHPIMTGLTFGFPDFDKIPKLRAVYAQRETLGEAAYINAVNNTLQARDDILELVSIALIFAVDQMTAASNALFDMMDEIMDLTKKMGDVVESASIHAAEHPQSDATSEIDDDDRDAIIRRARKKIKKAGNKVRSPKQEYDKAAQKGASPSSQIRNQQLPEHFPYGKVVTSTIPGQTEMDLPGSFTYMVLKGPDGDNIFIASQESTQRFRNQIRLLRENLGLAANMTDADDAIASGRESIAETLGRMAPAEPQAQRPSMA